MPPAVIGVADAASSSRFGAPSHRLEAQLQATGRVLELPNCHCVYLPGVMLINFGDPATCTSDIKVSSSVAVSIQCSLAEDNLSLSVLETTCRTRFWKATNSVLGLFKGELVAFQRLVNKRRMLIRSEFHRPQVVRDKMKVTEASARLDELMVAPPKYALWKMVLIGGIASSAIIPSGEFSRFFTLALDVLAHITRTYSFLWIVHRCSRCHSTRRSPRGRSSSPRS